MHELSVMEQTLAIATDHLRAQGGDRIHRLVLRIGEWSGVDPQALAFAFEVVRDGTPAAEASLELETVPLSCHCPDCGLDFRPEGWSLGCPDCGGDRTEVRAGKELELKTLEVS
jgi:hydrogenase nickel incorporation protein HypA/HybF